MQSWWPKFKCSGKFTELMWHHLWYIFHNSLEIIIKQNLLYLMNLIFSFISNSLIKPFVPLIFRKRMTFNWRISRSWMKQVDHAQLLTRARVPSYPWMRLPTVSTQTGVLRWIVQRERRATRRWWERWASTPWRISSSLSSRATSTNRRPSPYADWLVQICSQIHV